jgi:homoserine O-acetyltransferase
MIRPSFRSFGAMLGASFLVTVASARPQMTAPATTEGEFVVRNFKFHSGQSLPDVRLHYTTLGKPVRDAEGRTTNAVLILHGTGGSGHQFLAAYFASELFGPGQPLDATRYFIVLPDGIGHGQSSKPSDGLHAHFPQYDYDDMVALHYKLLNDGLGVNHLRLIFGTSMGCMHSFVWGETYPDFIDALMPMACLPVEIAGRNRVWRKMVMELCPGNNSRSWEKANRNSGGVAASSKGERAWRLDTNRYRSPLIAFRLISSDHHLCRFISWGK